MRRALKTFVVGFSIQFLLQNIGMIVKPVKLMRRVLKGQGIKQSAKFGLFMMCFNTLYKLVLCLLRRMGSLDDRKNAPVAGFISGLSLIIDTKSRRQLIAVLVMSRAVDSLFNQLDSHSKKVAAEAPESQHALLKPDSFFMRYKFFFCWFICNTFLQSLMGLKPDMLNRGMEKFFKTWSQQTKNDKLFKEVWIKMLKDGVPGF